MTKELKLNNISLSKNMYAFMKKLFPICRSITGNGSRETLWLIQELIPALQIHEVPSGTPVFDWTIPKEWNISDAYVKDSRGNRVIDFKKSNLHVLNYSAPISKKISLPELKKHLFTLPEHPNWIPYLTSYYKENWGFCLSQKHYDELKDDFYEVVIDSSIKDGSLTYGELFLPGESTQEVLFSCYICHPSMCNDNLSGIVLLTFLAQHLQKMPLKYSYRFLFIPETIGAVTWISRNEHNLHKIKHGLVATCVGDSGKFHYKRSRQKTAKIDKIVEKVLVDSNKQFGVLDFFPTGSDERQFCSPGFNLPVGSLMRTSYNNFPEYHTSADNLEFVSGENLTESFEMYKKVIEVLENDLVYLSLNQKCEPQLGKRSLYREIGSQKNNFFNQEALFWVLNFSDGKHSLLDISIKSKIPFNQIKKAADLLLQHGLLRQCYNDNPKTIPDS